MINFFRKIKPVNQLSTSTKPMFVAIALFVAYLFLGMAAQLVLPHSNMGIAVATLLITCVYIVLLILFRDRTEIFLFQIAYILYRFLCSNDLKRFPIRLSLVDPSNWIQGIIHIFYFIITILFTLVFLLSLYKKIPTKFLKTLSIAYISINVIKCIFPLAMKIILRQSIRLNDIFSTIQMLCLVAAIFIIFYFAENKANTSSLTFVQWLVIVFLLLWLISLFVPGVNTGGTNNSDKCAVCNGVGLVPKKGFGFTTCPGCGGSGIPPI